MYSDTVFHFVYECRQSLEQASEAAADVEVGS